jgi:two-component system, sensor histidine kinase YesM
MEGQSMSRSERRPRHPRFRSIQVSMAFAFSVLSVSTIVGAILISYSLTEETARIASQRSTRQLMTQIASSIDSYIDYMDGVSAFAPYDQDVQDFLAAPARKTTMGTELDSKLASRASAVLASVGGSRKDISLVAVFGYDGRFVAHDRSFQRNPFVDPSKQAWFIDAAAAGGKSVVSSSRVQNVVKDRYRWVISLSREIQDMKTGAGTGVLLIDLNYDVIERICDSVSLGKRGYVFIVDRHGEIVFHPRQQLVYGGLRTEDVQRVAEGTEDYFESGDKDGGKLYSVRTMRTTGWKVVGVNYRDELVENRDAIRVTYTAWGLGFFAVTIALSIVLSRRISKPIKRLRSSMRAVERGEFDIRVDIRSADEIGELGKDFNIMITEIGDLLRRITVQQEQKRKSELKALQMQINPHFLYNTLDSVIWMAEGGKQKEVIAMTSALARLFRLSISKGKEIITIGSEVEHVTNYLTIQKIRYKDKLDYRIEVDEELKRFKTVKIILQPLVENAIYHGIKNKATPGTVTITGTRMESGIELAVADDGIGMDADALERMRQKIRTAPTEEEGDEDDTHSGLGLRNVDERIKLYFGQEYGLEFESIEEGGTTGRVRLPCLEEETES